MMTRMEIDFSVSIFFDFFGIVFKNFGLRYFRLRLFLSYDKIMRHGDGSFVPAKTGGYEI